MARNAPAVPDINEDRNQAPVEDGSYGDATVADTEAADPGVLADDPEAASEHLTDEDFNEETGAAVERKDEGGEEDAEDEEDKGEDGGKLTKEQLAEIAGGEDDDEDAEDDEDGQQRRGRRRPNTQARRRQARQREREQIAALNARVDTLTQLLGNRQQAEQQAAEEVAEAQAEEAPARPRLEDFDFDNEKWSEALGQWTEDRVASIQQQAARDRQEGAQRAEQEQRRRTAEAFKERQQAARERYDDYDDVVMSDDTIIPANVVDLIIESELGPDLAYYLGENQDEAEKIGRMNPIQAARRIGIIEAGIQQAAKAPASGDDGDDADDGTDDETAAGEDDDGSRAEEARPAAKAGEPTQRKAPDERPAPRRTTKAPEPAPHLRGGGGREPVDPNKESIEEYVARREREEAGRV